MHAGHLVQQTPLIAIPLGWHDRQVCQPIFVSDEETVSPVPEGKKWVLAIGYLHNRKTNIMNDTVTRPLAERQAHLYALRTELGLPLAGMHSGPLRFAAVEAPDPMTFVALSNHACNGGFDIIAAIFSDPAARDPVSYVVIMRMAQGAKVADFNPFEIDPRMPLVMHLPQSGDHVVADERGRLTRHDGLPADDIDAAEWAAYNRVERATKAIAVPDTAVLETTELSPPQSSVFRPGADPV